LEDDVIIYLAGLCDGEAYIGIKKTKNQSQSMKKNGVRSPTYHERIQLRMVDPEGVLLFKQTFGGHHYREKAHCNNGRPLWMVNLSDKQAYEAVSRLYPYLRVKKKQAELIFKLREDKNKKHRHGHGLGKMPQEQLDYREFLWRSCKNLNGDARKVLAGGGGIGGN